MENNNLVGIVLAVVTFSTIGIGHVFVRKVNYLYGTKPAPLVFVVGLVTLFFSFYSESNLLSAVLGITAITIFWDCYELYRQENRIRDGHAPENPKRLVTNKIKSL